MMKFAAVLALSVTLAGLSAAAAPPGHTIDMTMVLQDEAGKPAKDTLVSEAKGDRDCANCPNLTLGAAVAHSLFATYPDERELSGEDKWARARLAQRVKEDKAAALTANEVTLIKRLLAKAYGPIVLLQAYPVLDPNAKPPESVKP